MSEEVDATEPVAWAVFHPDRAISFFRKEQDAVWQADWCKSVAGPLYRSPQSDRAIETLRSCASLLQTLAEDALKDDRIADWSMMSTMAEHANEVVGKATK